MTTQVHRRSQARPRGGGVAAAVAAAVVAVLLLASCSGDSGEDSASPEDVLAEARAQLDETSGVRIGLSTDELPEGVDGVLDATGVGTHAPAFEGEIKALVTGLTATVPVVALDGTVWAKLPFTAQYAEIDPADYGSPDPAQLLATEGGISSWLTEATEVQRGDQTRQGEAVVTSYTAVVPGDAVASVVPSADASEEFPATFEVDDDGRLVEAVLTGPFYGSAGDVAYTVTLSDYGTDEEITAP